MLRGKSQGNKVFPLVQETLTRETEKNCPWRHDGPPHSLVVTLAAQVVQ